MPAKITVNLKGLQDHLQENEQPIMNIPGMWDNGQQSQSIACDIVLTDQRLLGYYFVSFPRERLFLDTLPLSAIRTVTLRQKDFEPVFRELMVKTTDRSVYIRSQRKKIAALDTALRNIIEDKATETTATPETSAAEPQKVELPAYEQQQIHRPLEGSPLGMTILLTGGLGLEILGILLWVNTHSAQIGAPLLIAGFVSWLAAIILRKKR